MHVIAVNGSPRKSHNTATLLNHALDGAKAGGATAELFHLYDLQYKGCVSCFACKRKDNPEPERCALKDDLTPLLGKILCADVLLLGSPIYLGDVTGAMRSLLERLIFPNVNYDDLATRVFKGSISSAFFFTTGAPEEMAGMMYKGVFQANCQSLRLLGGSSEFLASFDTYQFDDYSKYAAGRFDEAHKARVKSEQFPLDCQKAFAVGARLAAGGKAD